MKYDVIVSDKMQNIPIAECGGIVLQPGDKLLVSSGLAVQLQKHYGKNLIVAGQVEKEKLLNGSFEYVSGKGKAVAQAAERAAMPPPAVESVSADKMVSGKKARSK